MAPLQVAMQGTGSNIQNTMGMSDKNARAGAPDLGQGFGRELTARELAARQHYVTPSNDLDANNRMTDRRDLIPAGRLPPGDPNALPAEYNNYDGLPVPYAMPTQQKEDMVLRQAVRKAAGQAQNGTPGVVRTDPITDGEVAYLKSMKDQAELAKFDDYVETFIDPRKPGNMRWLMEIYPDYVNRRLQQAHTDYEFALRNQLIDSWGINTFEDLHFKYLVDQGKIQGPALRNERTLVDSSYTPGWLSPYNFQSPGKYDSGMALPFASAKHGRRPAQRSEWVMDRSTRPLGRGNDENRLADGMYANGGPEPRPGGEFADTYTPTGLGSNIRTNLP